LRLKTPASRQASRHSPVRRHQPPGHLRHAPPGRPGRRPGVAQPTSRRGQAASLVAAQGPQSVRNTTPRPAAPAPGN